MRVVLLKIVDNNIPYLKLTLSRQCVRWQLITRHSHNNKQIPHRQEIEIMGAPKLRKCVSICKDIFIWGTLPNLNVKKRGWNCSSDLVLISCISLRFLGGKVYISNRYSGNKIIKKHIAQMVNYC